MISSGVPSRQPVRNAWTLEKLQHERAIALGQAIGNRTWNNYGSALNSYLNFIHMHNFPVEPSPDTLSFFVVFMSSHIKPASVDTYLSGICNQLEPYFPNVRNARKTPLVHRTLEGCKRLKGTATVRKRALSVDDISMVANTLTASSSHDDVLFVTQLLTGFYALLRLGELTFPDSKNLQDNRKVISRASLKIEENIFSFFLPGHKADKFFEGNTILLKKNSDVSDPHNALLRYITSRDRLFPYSSPLWLKHDGTVPTRTWFIRRMHQFFENDIAGQSMRAGGATALAEMGVSPSLIQATGRWASSAFQVYIRKNPVLIQALIYAHSNNVSSS